jgi:Tfp pilus assembly protein PilN
MNSFSPTSINLASQPFRRERAENAAWAAICAVLACSLLVLASLFVHERTQAAGLRRGINSEMKELRRLQSEQAKFSNILAKPQNADVFSTSVFLNELIARRGVSWTRVFKDLGTVMPGNMRLMRIALPQVAEGDASGTTHVQLDMVVATEQPNAVIDLLKRLEQSSLFGPASVMTQTPPAQNDPTYKYRVVVGYVQKL